MKHLADKHSQPATRVIPFPLSLELHRSWYNHYRVGKSCHRFQTLGIIRCFSYKNSLSHSVSSVPTLPLNEKLYLVTHLSFGPSKNTSDGELIVLLIVFLTDVSLFKNMLRPILHVRANIF